jgi:hypothetical protein
MMQNLPIMQIANTCRQCGKTTRYCCQSRWNRAGFDAVYRTVC